MKRYQTITPNELENIILCFADRISCSYCPKVDQCANDEILRNRIGLDCQKLLFNYLFEDVTDTSEISINDTWKKYLEEEYENGYNDGWEAGRKRLIEQIEEKAGIIRKERNKR